MDTTPGFSISLSSSTEQFNGDASSRGNNVPRYPVYACYDSRLRSYTTWRQFQQFDTAALAEAGFYYIGVLTVIRCFFCATELANPAYSDDPLLEHVKKSPNCEYLKQKQGEQRLKAYQERMLHGTLNSQQTNVVGNVDYTSTDIINIIMEQEDRADEPDGNINHSPTPRPSTRRNDLKQSIIEENTRLRKLLLCAVCKVTKKDICLLPCMHLCLCSTCADKRLICPICHKKISDKLKTLII